ncbi:MAG: RrF2 family transcriptional regulator, partial [Acidimicrobiales bacterium]
ARPPAEVTLGQIVSAVDGPIVAGDFGEPHQNGACSHEGQCVLLSVWADVGEHMRQHLDSFTLADMVLRARGQGPGSPDTVAPLDPDPGDLRLGQPVSN